MIVVSVEGQDDARKTQADFPHLTVLSDEGYGLSEAAVLIHRHVAPNGTDADVPTTILVDRQGIVRWFYRSPSVIARLLPGRCCGRPTRGCADPRSARACEDGVK